MSDQTRGVPDVAGALPLYAALRRYTRAVQSRLHGESKEESSEGMTMTGTGLELLRRLNIEVEGVGQSDTLKRLMDLFDPDNGWWVPDLDDIPESKRRSLLESWDALANPDSLETLANAMDGEPDRARFGQTPARLRKIAVAMRFEAVRQGRAGS